MKLSVIILNYNTSGLLKTCLSAVLESNGFEGRDMEVIVVDNNSSDGSAEMVRKEFPEVKLIRNKKNLGFSAGNNVGIRKAKGGYVLLLNSDTLVEPDVLITVLKVMENDRSIGAATCLLQTSDGKIDPASHRGFPTPWNALSYFLGLEKLFPKTRLFGGYHQGWKNLKVPHEVDCISAAFMMVPAEVINQIGLLDERFFMYGEDIDWCLRIKEAGFKIFFYPGVKTLHLKKQSGREQSRDGDLRRQTQKLFMDSMWQFYKKHYFGRYPLILNWLVKLGVEIRKAI
ncbi:glycosyltransferase family 2 protein [Candidatus Collierbacteria bacterium]|nr:glycosyltransferase family 2 protein [Candidatus Collierbacteria bacterium]